jgi:hypothetical protein
MNEASLLIGRNRDEGRRLNPFGTYSPPLAAGAFILEKATGNIYTDLKRGETG